MSSKKPKGRIKKFSSVVTARVNVETLSPAVWAGWETRAGEKYFGLIRRADGTIERTRLERDDLQATAEFVAAQRARNAASIRGRQLVRVDSRDRQR